MVVRPGSKFGTPPDLYFYGCDLGVLSKPKIDSREITTGLGHKLDLDCMHVPLILFQREAFSVQRRGVHHL